MKFGAVLFMLVMLATAGGATFVLFVMFNPAIQDKSGPIWFWRLGKYDPLRNLFFKSNGSLRQYSRPLIAIILVPLILICLTLTVVAIRG